MVAFYHDEDCVRFPAVRVVVVSAVFDVGVHDARRVVSALVGVFEVVPSVHAPHAAFVAFDGERVAVIEGERSGAYFVVGGGDACYVAASENLRVFFRGAVFVEGDFVDVHDWFLPFLVCWLLCPRVVGGVRVVWALLVVVEVAAAGLTIAGAGAVVRGSTRILCYNSRRLSRSWFLLCHLHARVSTYVDVWLVGWLVVA